MTCTRPSNTLTLYRRTIWHTLHFTYCFGTFRSFGTVSFWTKFEYNLALEVHFSLRWPSTRQQTPGTRQLLPVPPPLAQALTSDGPQQGLGSVEHPSVLVQFRIINTETARVAVFVACGHQRVDCFICFDSCDPLFLQDLQAKAKSCCVGKRLRKTQQKASVE